MTAPVVQLVALVQDYRQGDHPVHFPRPVPMHFAPRYVRTRGQSRWHRPRSGRLYGGPFAGPLGGWRPALSLWCGQSLNDLREALQAGTADELDADVCGPCEGKALGAGQDPAPPGLPPLVFSPTLPRPPRVCPGSGTDRLAAPVDGSWRVGRCLACGTVQPMRARGGYSGGWGLARHLASEGRLVDPCDLHGWAQLREWEGECVCSCRVVPTDASTPVR